MTFVLIHSPLVGPLTWQPVADELSQRGHPVVVPNLLGVAAAAAPYWPAVRAAVSDAVAGVTTELVLVPHSNAGLFVPVLVETLDGRAQAMACSRGGPTGSTSPTSRRCFLTSAPGRL